MVKAIDLKALNNREYFLIHGYTGSPDDFNGLPEYLHQKFNVNVKVPLLTGHGTKIQDLDKLAYQDFLNQIESELQKELAAGKEIIIGGVSFGAQLAMYLAARYPVQGLFIACIPYKLRFPFNFSITRLIGYIKKYWRKPISAKEKKLREKTFYYQQMHVNSLKITKQANANILEVINNIKAPVLFVHSFNDHIGQPKSVELLEKQISSPMIKKVFFHDYSHNIFFTGSRFGVYSAVGKFFEKKSVVDLKSKKVAAIVPAYNEGKRIGNVLPVLLGAKILDEVIVVDDGSSDNTSEQVKKFPKIKLLQNSKNLGKAESMQRGVESTDADIIFFCDADLHGLTPEIVESVVTPVINDQYSMFIGVRNNPMQKAVTLFALNSGERAMHRSLWQNLPDSFKHRYRIEAGLNFLAKRSDGGLGWKKFDYYQTLKEKKYGFLRGTFLRWWMNFDVGVAYGLAIIKKFFSHKKTF